MNNLQEQIQQKILSNEHIIKALNYSGAKQEIVSTIAYLFGVSKENFEDGKNFLQDKYNELNQKKASRIIRNLCWLRTCLERAYPHIYRKMRLEGCSLGLMPEYIPYEIITNLANDGIRLTSHHEPAPYIIDCNKMIQERIDNCKGYFPNWLNWSYVKDLFIMPNGLTEAGIKAAAEEYYNNKLKLPYHVYMNIDPNEGDGNILFNDLKFVTILYEFNGDLFDDASKVSGAGLESKSRLSDFINTSDHLVMVVDGENSDPYKLCAMLNEMDETERLRIEKILIFDDVNASSAWARLEKYAHGVKIYRHLVTRLKDGKSMLDHFLIAEVCKEYYENNIDSFILLSSDSDFWALISSLKEARFMLMPERGVTAYVLRDAMKKHNVPFCYLDDYYSGNLDAIKIENLIADAEKKLSEALSLNINDMMDELLKSTRSKLTDIERQRFVNKHLKTMRLVIDAEGDVKLEMKKA